MKEIEKSEKNQSIEKIDRRKNMPHLFKPGQSGNPAGKPRGTKSITINTLISEIKKVEKEKGKTILRKFIEMAYTNPQIMIALMKKIIPDVTKSESDMKIEHSYSDYSEIDSKELIDRANEIISRARTFIVDCDIN